MPLVEEERLVKLARLVLKFSHCDSAIAEKGWDGAELESAWEKSKADMVRFAESVMDGCDVGKEIGE